MEDFAFLRCEVVASGANLLILPLKRSRKFSVASQLRPVNHKPGLFPYAPAENRDPCHLQACLMERAIRLTSQRRAILQIIEMATKHFDASQIRKVQRPNASVGRGAVYRRFTSVEAPSLDRRS